jgi:hypothetical protein
VWVWLVLALFTGALTVERVNALLGSASVFPGISVVGIMEVLAPAETAMLFFVRWWELRTGRRRRWRWLFVAAFVSFLTLLIVGAATLASRPGGLRSATPVIVLLIGGAITAVAWWRSAVRRPPGAETSSP